MSHEERMRQLGRRATQQEPAALALPRCVQASESVKPVSCVRFRIERHGWGEGRLPIPAAVSVRTGEELDAQHQQLSTQRDRGVRSSPARRPQAAAALRPQANPQLDAIKARVSAAKAFSRALTQHNAQQQQSARRSSATTSSSSQGEAGTRGNSAGRQAAGTVALLQAPKQPLVERHIPPAPCADRPAQAVQQQQQQQQQEDKEELAASADANTVVVPAAAQHPAEEPVLARSSSASAAADAAALPASLPVGGRLSAQVSASSVAAAAADVDAPIAAEAEVASAAATPAAGPAAEQVFDSAAATCRLLAFTQGAGASHGSRPAAAAAHQPAAAGGTAQQHQQQRAAQVNSQAAAPGLPIAVPASSTGGSPHWSPVPPRMQLQQPRVVHMRPMAMQEADGQHSEALRAAGQQQPLDSCSSTCRSHRVSLSSAPPAAAASGGLLQAQGSRRAAVRPASSGPPGFSNPELAQLAASAAQQHRLVLPALCACGHGASVLDASYSSRCCSNCPLRGDAAAHERLLLGLLSSML